MRAEGCLSMLITARGRFQARLARISLSEMRLSAAEENLPRIAFIAVPSDTALILFSIGKATALVCGGIAINSIESRGASSRHALSCPRRRHLPLGMISLQADQLIKYGAALTGACILAFAPGRALAASASGW